jgi:hypothetical protein
MEENNGVENWDSYKLSIYFQLKKYAIMKVKQHYCNDTNATKEEPYQTALKSNNISCSIFCCSKSE